MADAHAEFAVIYFYYDWDWEKAEEEFQKTISLNSSYAWAHQFYAWFLAATGRTEEAHASIRRALELDPLAILAYMTAADVFWLSREYDQAIAQLHETLDLFPNDPQALSRLGRNHVEMGMFTEAVDEMERAVALSPGFIEHYWMLGHAYAVAGETVKAQKVLDDLHDLAKQRYVLPLAFAVIHTGLGENDEALEWLERAYQDRNNWMVFLQVAPWFDPLRSDPRFQDLQRRMNFPE
jgi:serine/threonine-protein kinase